MGSSPTSGMMDCSIAQKKIDSFIKGTLNGNELRRFFYHIKDCKECNEVLLDEFSFYTAFNDLDRDLDFNYKEKLKIMMKDTEDKIKIRDSYLRHKYFIMSLLICFVFLFLVVIALKVVYR